jgi:hypothetical protein
MKAVRFFPLAFIANVHGFLIFVPYLAAFLALAHLLRGRRAAIAVAVPATVRSTP